MAMDFTRFEDGEKFWCSNMLWAKIQDIAIANGWVPTGTCFVDDDGEEDPNWSGGYDVNDGQCLDEIDAENLMIALDAVIAKGIDYLENKDFNEDDRIKLDEFIKWGRDDGCAVGWEIW